MWQEPGNSSKLNFLFCTCESADRFGRDPSSRGIHPLVCFDSDENAACFLLRIDDGDPRRKNLPGKVVPCHWQLCDGRRL